MEQRINTIEEELKVLKSQIKAVLLDIKEYMATGNGHAYSPSSEEGGSSTPVPADIHAGSGPINVSSYGGGPMPPGIVGGYGGFGGPGAVPGVDNSGLEAVQVDSDTEPVHLMARKSGRGAADTGSGERTGRRARPASRLIESEYEDESADTGSCTDTDEPNRDKNKVVDLLTMSVLAQWVSRATAAMGKNQIVKLVEIYDVTGHLPPRMKDAILLLVDLCGQDADKTSEETPVAESVPAAVSIQMLIELDSVLRYRDGALESVVFSLLGAREQRDKKGSHG